MTNVLDILSEYGNACKCDYQQGDNIEDAIDTIVEFCRQHGYDFSDDEAKELRSELYLCPLIKGIFQNGRNCKGCPYSIKGSIYSYSYACNFVDEKEKNDEHSL